MFFPHQDHPLLPGPKCLSPIMLPQLFSFLTPPFPLPPPRLPFVFCPPHAFHLFLSVVLCLRPHFLPISQSLQVKFKVLKREDMIDLANGHKSRKLWLAELAQRTFLWFAGLPGNLLPLADLTAIARVAGSCDIGQVSSLEITLRRR